MNLRPAIWLSVLIIVSCSPPPTEMKENAVVDSLNAKRIIDSAVAWHPQPVTCTHTDLSAEFDLEISATRYPTENTPDSTFVTVSIRNKKGGERAIFSYYSTYFFDSVFFDCNRVRSYSTGRNENADIPDNDFGDAVVADLNFDGRDDLALKSDSGGNGGPVYYFYIQNKEGHFDSDPFLSDSVSFFPVEIDKSKRVIKTLVHANAYEMSEKTFVLSRDGNWRETNHRMVR